MVWGGMGRLGWCREGGTEAGGVSGAEAGVPGAEVWVGEVGGGAGVGAGVVLRWEGEGEVKVGVMGVWWWCRG